MTAKRNTDVVPVTDEMMKTYSMCRGGIAESIRQLIDASPELTALIAENERLALKKQRMHNSLKAMYNAVFQLRGALVYINEMEEAQRILGE